MVLEKCQRTLDLLEKTLYTPAVSFKTKNKLVAFQLKKHIWATKQNFLEMLRQYVLLRNTQLEHKLLMNSLVALKAARILLF